MMVRYSVYVSTTSSVSGCATHALVPCFDTRVSMPRAAMMCAMNLPPTLHKPGGWVGWREDNRAQRQNYDRNTKQNRGDREEDMTRDGEKTTELKGKKT